jgi:hypothetical protein
VTRWAWVLAIAVLVALTLRPMFTKEFRIPEGVEETRMFWVAGEQTVRFVIPAKTDFVELHVVSALEPEPRYDPGAEHPFALGAVLTGRSNQELFKWELFAAGRVSFERFPPIGDDARGARLVGSRDWVTDNRVLTLPVANLVLDTNGELIVRAKDAHRLLVRGFAVRGGQRVRLTVVGARGRDYELRRVVLSKFRRLRERSGAAIYPEPMELAPGQSVALNLTAATDLWLEGHMNCLVTVTDGIHHGGVGERLPLNLKRGEESLISVTDLGTRTLAIGADQLCQFRVLADEDGAASMVGAKATPYRDKRFVVEPDIRDSSFYLLDWYRPVVSLVEAGERRLELSLRRIADDGSDARRAKLSARYEVVREDGRRESREVKVERVWSRYESMDGFIASASHTVHVRLPADAVRVEIFGAGNTAVKLAVPTGLNDEIAPPYDKALPAGRRWFSAPQISKRVRSILATNEDDLEKERRIRTLRYQPRVVGASADPGADDERGRSGKQPRGRKDRRDGGGVDGGGEDAPRVEAVVLSAEGAPFEHRIFLRPEEDAAPTGALWTRVGAGGADVRVRPQSGGWLTVSWRLPPEALGETVSVVVDGVEFAAVRAATATQEVRVRVAPGMHHVEVPVHAARGVVFVNAAPATPATRYQKRSAFALGRGDSIAFRVPPEESGRVTVVLQVFTAKAGETWVLPYNIFGNEGDERRARLHDSGTAQGTTKRERSPVLWDVAGGEAAGFASVRIKLGRPDAPTLRSVRLRLAGGTAERVWVRAIMLSHGEVVGQSAGAAPKDGPRYLRQSDR